MKVTITPKSRNRDNSRELFNKSLNDSPITINKTGAVVSFDIQISTSGSFGTKIELSVADLYAIQGKLAEFQHLEASQARTERIRAKRTTT